MGKTILAIDDNRDFLRLMELMLSKVGYTPLLAVGAVEALELLETQIPDAILLDIMMPDRDGLEFLGNLRWEPRFEKIPVIVLTAMTLNDDEREFIDTFAAGFVDKARAMTVLDELRRILPETV